MPDALSNAKAALSHANQAFPSASLKSAGAAAPVKSATPSIAKELEVTEEMKNKARSVLPKMHKGGTVKADGDYNLKAGEHVLTASEAAKARQHGLMAAGLKSLAQPALKAGKPTASIGAIEPMPAKPKTFTDKNLERGYGEGGANNVTIRGAKPGASISPEPNASSKMTTGPHGPSKT